MFKESRSIRNTMSGMLVVGAFLVFILSAGMNMF